MERLSNMQIIADTQILISREFDRAVPRRLQDLLKIFHELRIQIMVHPQSLEEIERDKNITNASALSSKLKTYPMVQSPPNPQDDNDFQEIVGAPQNIQDKVDNHLLYFVYGKKENLLLTEDPETHKKAEALQISDRVLYLKEALGFFTKQSKEERSESVLSREKNDSVPQIYFYRTGDKWRIGEEGREGIFNHMKGFELIHFLLLYETVMIKPFFLSNLGKSMSEDPADSMDLKQLEISGALYQQKHDIKSRAAYRNKKKILKERLEAGDYKDALEALSMKEEIDEIEATRHEKGIRDPKSEEEKARVNVSKRIGEALKKIHNDDTVSYLKKYLNRSTIKTGDHCKYSPIPDEKPRWILYQMDLA
jgi:predicted nucleic acid-binding protein